MQETYRERFPIFALWKFLKNFWLTLGSMGPIFVTFSMSFQINPLDQSSQLNNISQDKILVPQGVKHKIFERMKMSSLDFVRIIIYYII